MRKIKEILRLRYELGLGQTQIARSCQIGQATVHRYLERFAASGVSWPLSADWDEARLEELLFVTKRGRPTGPVDRPAPDFAALQDELRKHPHLTLQLLWEEYRAQQPGGYGYSRFCDLYRRWQESRDVVLRQEHRAGEKLFVDWAGAKIPLSSAEAGVAESASVFVAVLGASNYTFAYATAHQDLPSWIDAHVRAFEFFEGVPQLVIPDNLRTGVDRACRYEPDLNRTYHEMAQHYGVAVLPARPYKPRDKAKVEVGVQVVQRWIVAALRHQRFGSVAEVNEAIHSLLTHLNHRRFRKREGTRASLFAELDRPALQSLPRERYQVSAWKNVRASLDYHVEIDRHYYSVPYQLTGQLLEARWAATTVEIFHRGLRVASHRRSNTAYRHTTNPEHRPKSHQAHLEWTPSRLVHWAESVGPATAQVVEAILTAKPHPEMGYRSCLGILRLAKIYSAERLEAASRRALQLEAFSYQSLRSILKNSLDRQALLTPETQSSGPLHENVRGAGYYDPPKPFCNKPLTPERT
ncbi:MAG: IS21 family transposase [Acidobacteriaceae bacterium]|nr:IS21 family transposase [Acidobacteriaceae bacterium]